MEYFTLKSPNIFNPVQYFELSRFKSKVNYVDENGDGWRAAVKG